MSRTKKMLGVCMLILGIAFLIFPPIYAGTGSYPLTIVSGNSMYPNLQNGDLIFYKAVNPAHLTNGTVMVFVQKGTGNSVLDDLIRPVIMHRIVSEEISANGTISFQTKGDNNNANDPFTTSANNVIGVPVVVIPRVGLLFLFLQSPQGLIAVVGIIALGYLGYYDNKRKDDKRKEKLLGALANRVIYKQISDGQFKNIELAMKYSDELDDHTLKANGLKALTDWLEKGTLYEDWKINSITCKKCSKNAVELEASGHSIAICSHCNRITKQVPPLTLNETTFDKLVLESIDEALTFLGDESKMLLYHHIKQEYAIDKNEIPKRLDDFSFALTKIIDKANEALDELFTRILSSKVSDEKLRNRKGTSFQSYVTELRQALFASATEHSEILAVVNQNLREQETKI